MKKRHYISDRLAESNEVENTAEMRFVEILSLSIRQWHPDPDGNGRPSQLHLMLKIAESLPIVLRLKSAEVTDALIEALVRNRQDVWPAT